MTTFPILDDLRAGAAFPGWRTQLMTFGQFVGGWDLAAEYYDAAGTCTYRGQWRWSFAWILDGRAIQDVWILPGFFHGTTLRVYDPGLDAWHIIWSDPLKAYFTRQIGRQ